jgi:hypothetical protein
MERRRSVADEMANGEGPSPLQHGMERREAQGNFL